MITSACYQKLLKRVAMKISNELFLIMRHSFGKDSNGKTNGGSDCSFEVLKVFLGSFCALY